MPNRKVFKSDKPKAIAVVPYEVNAGLDGYVPIGEYHHEEGQDILGNPLNHVMFHHVQDLLYRDGQDDAMNYPIRMIQSGPEPLEPGPMDFNTSESRLTSYTVPYTMAYPNCILMVTGRKEMSQGLQGLRATHGGEPLQLAYYTQANDWVCWAAIFIGSNLTLEEADLIVEADEPITPLIGRIIDKEHPVVDAEFVSNTENSSVFSLKFEQLPEQKYLRFLIGYRGFKDYVGTSGTPVDLLAYKRIMGGTPATPTASASKATWTYSAGTATYTGGNDDANEYLELTYPGGATDSSKYNAIRFTTTLSQAGSMVIKFMSPNGASRTHILMGPITDQEVMIESSASGAYYHSIRISSNENCTLSNVQILADSLSLTTVMLASPDVVDMQPVGGNINLQFNNMGFAANLGMSYKEEI
ncbi:hypothetical protein PP764_gp52 [Escherichia phage phi G17]|uniref:Uncharacterized protein n=1 Tax=Escherichia phage phi G17 TaxID=2234086 RepID=A0A2Z4Q003_9CAUD|nr:hypothetical protein PP764_gp52 [Escherichia phage phi G17]AWY03418.1 hypothetical protein [Escherichia phage phi G17]